MYINETHGQTKNRVSARIRSTVYDICESANPHHGASGTDSSHSTMCAIGVRQYGSACTEDVPIFHTICLCTPTTGIPASQSSGFEPGGAFMGRRSLRRFAA
jgi:hypothetical protein